MQSKHKQKIQTQWQTKILRITAFSVGIIYKKSFEEDDLELVT